MSPNNIPFLPGDRVIAYLRDSGATGQELSTEQQEEQLRAWCDQNSLVLTQLFIDAARQGSSTEKRDQFQEMISFLHDRNKKEKGVLIWSLSRFARNQDDSDYFKADLRRRNKIVWSMTENIPDTTEGRLIEKIYDFSNEKYLENLSIDVKRGLHHNVSEYRAVPGNPPFGFKKTTKVIGVRRDNTPHIVSTWIIDPDYVPIIQQAFKMRAAGYQIEDIHNQFHIMKNRSSYSTFFRNPLYTGELHFGGMVIQDFCEPIITRDVWEKVQSLNNKYTSHSRTIPEEDEIHPRRMSSSYILSGVIYCRQCGELMVGNTVKSKDARLREYYLCNNHKANMACSAPRIPAREVEGIVIDAISEYIQHPDALIDRQNRMAERSEDRKNELRANIKQITREIDDARRQISNITDKIANLPDTPLSLIDRLRDLELAIQKKSAAVDRLQSQLNNVNVRARTPAEIDELSENMLRLLTSDSPSEKHAIINIFIDRFDAERVDNSICGMLYFKEDNSLTGELIDSPPKFMPME
jgi:DNA invertase Pin-like site-specific DNA recombinase